MSNQALYSKAYSIINELTDELCGEITVLQNLTGEILESLPLEDAKQKLIDGLDLSLCSLNAYTNFNDTFSAACNLNDSQTEGLDDEIEGLKDLLREALKGMPSEMAHQKVLDGLKFSANNELFTQFDEPKDACRFIEEKLCA